MTDLGSTAVEWKSGVGRAAELRSRISDLANTLYTPARSTGMFCGVGLHSVGTNSLRFSAPLDMVLTYLRDKSTAVTRSVN